MRTSFATTAAIVVLVTACSTLEDPQHPFSRGWRTGEIEMLGSSTTPFPPGAIDCRALHAVKAQVAPSYAYVQFDFSPTPKYFGSNPKQRHIIALVSPDSHAAEGESVRVNIIDCSRPITPLNGGS